MQNKFRLITNTLGLCTRQVNFRLLQRGLLTTTSMTRINTFVPYYFSQVQTQTRKQGPDYPAPSSEVQGNGYYMQQIFTACLAEYGYYIESKGQAIVIDPMRDTEPYIQLAASRNAQIKYVLLTHFHADFVAGHHELKRNSNCKVLMGPNATASYVDQIVNDGEEIQLGSVKVRFIHTPGHTMESTSFLLIDSEGKPNSLFTGDTLFLGEVGRPDLAVKGNSLTEADLAGYLYRSLREKIMTLPDDVQIYPGHGAGSACGKNISAGFTCTIGKQKASNYALQDMTQEEFIKVVTNDIPPPPKYFFHNVSMNKMDDLDNVVGLVHRNSEALSVQKFKQLRSEQNVIVLDTRSNIKDGVIKGSINISNKMPLANWVGTLLSPKVPIVFIADAGNENQVVVRLARIGFDNILGYLSGDPQSWKQEGLDIVVPNLMENDWVKQNTGTNKIQLLDVRNRSEWIQYGVFKGAKLIELGTLEERSSELDKSKPIAVHCHTGQRAKIAGTLLQSKGFSQVYICKSGFESLVADTGFELVKPQI